MTWRYESTSAAHTPCNVVEFIHKLSSAQLLQGLAKYIKALTCQAKCNSFTSPITHVLRRRTWNDTRMAVRDKKMFLVFSACVTSCNIMQSCRWHQHIVTSRKWPCSSETQVSTYKTTRCHKGEYHNVHTDLPNMISWLFNRFLL